MARTRLRVDLVRSRDGVVFALFGALDRSTAPVLAAAIHDVVEPESVAVVDAAGLESVCASGLRRVVEPWLARGNGSPMLLVTNAGRTARALLDCARIDGVECVDADTVAGPSRPAEVLLRWEAR